MAPEPSCRARLLSEHEYRMGRWNLALALRRGSVIIAVPVVLVLMANRWQASLFQLSLFVTPLLGLLLWYVVDGWVSTGHRGDVRLGEQELLFLHHRLHMPVRHAAIADLDCVQRGGAVLRIGVRGEPDWYLVVSRLDAEDLYELLVDRVHDAGMPCLFGEAERLRDER
jgi:hypothetical protein